VCAKETKSSVNELVRGVEANTSSIYWLECHRWDCNSWNE